MISASPRTGSTHGSVGSRLAFFVWGIGLAAYVVAVAGRTSLGVAGLQAADRFSIDASTLATFSVVQLAVYAAAQIPAGMVLDRIGSRKLITIGVVVLSTGQLLLGLVNTLPLALVARVLIGLGDAAVLVSVLSLIPVWFRPRMVPMMTQVTGIVGQLGQVISAVPFLAVLLTFGWTPAFASLAGAGLLLALLAGTCVRDRPTAPNGRRSVDSVAGVPPLGAAARETAPTILREPGVWLGFFTHFVTLFPTNTFLLLWGVPFLTVGQGVSAQRASALLTIGALAGLFIGPALGELVARYPTRRSWLVLGTVALSTGVWALVLVPTGPRPFWQLVLLSVTVAAGVATCTIGFDFARTFAAPSHLGTAIGMVNVGGYVASLVAILLFGLVLDHVRPSGQYVLADFRLAFTAQLPLLAVGVVGVLLSRRATTRRTGRRT